MNTQTQENTNQITSPFSFNCNGSRINVSKEWILPLPIAASYSNVSYEFCTENGDINFSLVFIAIDEEEDILVYPERVGSDVEPIRGSCQLNSAGTLVFMWDNSYSWFTDKSLTYTVKIEQEPQPNEVSPRIEASKQQLRATNHELANFKKRLSGVSDVISSISTDEITALENMILKLRNQLVQKKRILKVSIAEKKSIIASIRECEANRRGLYLRTLNNFELAMILSYLDPRTVMCVCKLWKDLLTCEHPVTSDYAPAPLSVAPEMPTELKESRRQAPRSNSSETKATPDSKPEHVIDTSVVEALSSMSDEKPHISADREEEVKTVESGSNAAAGQHSRSRSYRSDVVHYVKGSLDSLKDMEAEKSDIRRKISTWKKQFEMRYGRPPSDEEKIRNIPELFQRYSMINRISCREAERVMGIAKSMEKIEKIKKPLSSK